MLLKNRSAIITGGSQGIGYTTALELAKEGANVCITYRKHKENAILLENKIKEMGLKAIAISCDTSVFLEAEKVIKKSIEVFGKIDILVNNAGMNWDSVSWKMTEEQWDRVIDVNLKGYFNFMSHTIPYFKKQKYGKIINVTSINGLRGKFGQANYSASKAGIIGLTKAVAKELGFFNINVNAVAPGLIETSMLKESEFRDKIIEIALSEMALNKVGKPEDLANLIVFLGYR